ncbi:hypothetical protein D3C78_1008170 [compost metagenome]
MPGLIDLKARDHSISNTAVVVDERHRAHDLAHAQGGHQLVASSARAIDGDLGQTIITTGKRNMLSRREPVAEKVLTHTKAQAAHHDQTQPPVVEDDRTGHDILMVAVPVHHHTQYQGRQAHRFDDRNQGVVAEVAHHRPIHAKANKQGNGNNRRNEKQPRMFEDRIHHFVDAQTHHEGQPQCTPDQQRICRYLNQPLLPARQAQ